MVGFWKRLKLSYQILKWDISSRLEFLGSPLPSTFPDCIFVFFSSTSDFEIKELSEERFNIVDLVETAFNKLAENVVSVVLLN